MRVWILDTTLPQLNRDSLAPIRILRVDLFNPGTTGGNRYHQITLCLDLCDQFIVCHIRWNSPEFLPFVLANPAKRLLLDWIVYATLSSGLDHQEFRVG